MTGTVFDIKEFAVFDGPGIRTTVFMKGCPLRCAWCHNPEGLSVSPEIMVSRAACVHCGACEAVCPTKGNCTACGKCIPACKGNLRKIAGVQWDAEKLSERLIKDKDVYALSDGGVTFSGGEPLMQWDFVSHVLRRLRDAGIHTAIETSGFCSDAIFSEAMELCSLIMMDWKVSDPDQHLKWTGAAQDSILRHAKMLAAGDTPFILRLPVIPEVNDDEAHFAFAAELVKDAKALVRVDLLPYQPAAGAKYEMVGREYGFAASRPPRMYTEAFDRYGIRVQEFR